MSIRNLSVRISIYDFSFKSTIWKQVLHLLLPRRWVWIIIFNQIVFSLFFPLVETRKRSSLIECNFSHNLYHLTKFSFSLCWFCTRNFCCFALDLWMKLSFCVACVLKYDENKTTPSEKKLSQRRLYTGGPTMRSCTRLYRFERWNPLW